MTMKETDKMNPLDKARIQLEAIRAQTLEIIPEQALLAKLVRSIETNTPLRIKLGIDPTTKDVHIGHMVTYRLVRTLQDFGHQAVLIIGDYTARIGDPTGKNKERTALTQAQVEQNAANYTEQIFKVINPDQAEIHHQSSWFGTMELADVIGLASRFSVAQLLAHETFRSRLDAGTRLSLHELFYPLLQARDSVEIQADIEIGGMDQKFNILCGRDLMRENGLDPQAAAFVPLLSGTDGLKMSKTSGNAINVLDDPQQMYGKVMSLSDELLPEYYILTMGIKAGDFPEDPYQAKRQLAKMIVQTYHGEADARQAEDHFTTVFSRKQMPDQMPEYHLTPAGEPLSAVLKSSGLVTSSSEVRRLVQQGAVSLNGEKIDDFNTLLTPDAESGILKVGKRRFLKLID